MHSKQFQYNSHWFPHKLRTRNIFVALPVLPNCEGSATGTTQVVRAKIWWQDVLIRFWGVLELVCFDLLGPYKTKFWQVTHSPLSFLEELPEIAFYSRSTKWLSTTTTTVLWHEKNVSCSKVPAPNPISTWSTDTGTCSLDSMIWILNIVTVSAGEFVVCLTAAKTSPCLFLGAEGRVCLCSNPNWASWP